jgi:hypothetical protein
MYYKTTVLILGLVSKIFAANFSVVSFDGDCTLNAGGQSIKMTADPKCSNLYKATANVKVGTEYYYTCGGKDDVKRTLAEENTHNELVGRAKTVVDMPEFGYPNAEPWERSIGRTELFDPDYVPIVIVDTKKDFFVSASGSSFNKMTFILKDSVFTFEDVKVNETKNDEEHKFQFEVTLPDGGILNRDTFKFRPSSTDPSFIRQILYGDIAHAIGNPAHESVAARIYLNDGTGVGLYVLQEDVTAESFANSAFFGNPDGTITPHKEGIIYDCSTNADFNVNDPGELGAFQNLKNPNDQKIELDEMTRQIDLVDINDANAVKNIDDNWLDLDTLYRAIALEYLGGHWDSYWFLTTNFMVYHPADEEEGPEYQRTKYKYYFVDQDFDQTFSIGLSEKLKLTEKPYTDFVNKEPSFWKDISNDSNDLGSRVFINKFIGCNGADTCETKTLFESHLKSIVQHIFNPVAIGRKVEGYRNRLDDEVRWDHSFPRLHTGSKPSADIDSYEMYDRSFNEGVCSSHGLLTWVQAMADNVCKQFNMEYDKVALTPEDAKKMNAQKIDPGKAYDANASHEAASKVASGSVMNQANVTLAMIATILSIVLFL